MYRFDFDVRQFRNITTYACSNRKISVIKDKTLLRKDTCEQRSFIRICHWQHIFNQLGAAWSIAKWTTTLAAHIMSKSNFQETAQDSTLPDGGMTLGPTWESQVCFKGGAVWLWHGRGNNIWAQPTIYLPVGCWHISLSNSHCLCRDPSVIVLQVFLRSLTSCCPLLQDQCSRLMEVTDIITCCLPTSRNWRTKQPCRDAGQRRNGILFFFFFFFVEQRRNGILCCAA